MPLRFWCIAVVVMRFCSFQFSDKLELKRCMNKNVNNLTM